MHALRDGGGIHEVSEAQHAHEVGVQVRQGDTHPRRRGGSPEGILVVVECGGWSEQPHTLTVLPTMGGAIPPPVRGDPPSPAGVRCAGHLFRACGWRCAWELMWELIN